MYAKSLQSTICDPMNRSTPGCVCGLHHVELFGTFWTVARQVPLSMGLSWQECWSGLPFPPPGDLPDPGNEPKSLVSPALPGGFFTTEPPGNPRSPLTIIILAFQHPVWFNPYYLSFSSLSCTHFFLFMYTFFSFLIYCTFDIKPVNLRCTTY